jgi:acid phosphatase type 7
MTRRFCVTGLLSACVLGFVLCIPVVAGATVDATMDAVVTRLYETLSLEELYALDDARVHELITPQERQVFATKHWHFDVDVPVVVSVMRHVEQRITPFWLEERGFTKTDLTVKNSENWEYEVWQKDFPAGRVELGINGFDNFRPHYLVAVGPQDAGARVTLSNFHPERQAVLPLQKGVMTYHDWTELVLTEVPESLLGQHLLTTIRGRGREAALVGAFRTTPFPSSEKPGPVYLTWSGDPKTTQNIQWRTSEAVDEGIARYRKKGSGERFAEVQAARLPMEDRMLANDRHCHWFTATLEGLAPETTYEYQIGSRDNEAWREAGEFITAPDADKPFEFLFCTDTHSDEQWGLLMKSTFDLYPDAAFVSISGDLVGTGLERQDWDTFLTYGEPVFQSRPVMPAIGNHDAQLGLGAGMYLDIFALPEDGPKDIPAKSAYTFTYSNAQFFVLDVMSPTEPQTVWLREQLEASDARWKIAVFHFPFYSARGSYPELERQWGGLFDEFHVDLALTGHIHTHMRTYPMHGGKVVDSPAEGTVYVTSISKPYRPKPEYAEFWHHMEYFCNVISIDGDRLEFRAINPEGAVRDEFVIEK